jgi:hypothetical protein
MPAHSLEEELGAPARTGVSVCHLFGARAL